MVPKHRIDFYGYAVACDSFLLFSGHRSGADVDNHRAVDASRNDPEHTRTAQVPVTPQTEYHAALVLLRDTQSCKYQDSA